MVDDYATFQANPLRQTIVAMSLLCVFNILPGSLNRSYRSSSVSSSTENYRNGGRIVLEGNMRKYSDISFFFRRRIVSELLIKVLSHILFVYKKDVLYLPHHLL